MSRNRRQVNQFAVSLFPFLAVLICTMGVLIIMLVLAVKSAEVNAQQVRDDYEQEVDQQRLAILDKLDLEQLRAEKFADLRIKTQDKLRQEKLRRSHFEDEIRKKLDEFEDVKAQFGRLDSDFGLAAKSSSADQTAIARMAEKIQQREQELKKLRSKIADAPPLYSIVPTRSASGTGRRPIYVECDPSGITLQPSGIKLTLDQFTLPIVAGNPLDAALLATREYWNRFDAGSSKGEPYPLIVVRPGGASAYSVVRRAMSSWDDEFGYELVEAGKELDWGQSDSNLVANVESAIDIAMRRQIQLVELQQVRWMTDRPNARRRRFASGSGFAGQPGNTNGQQRDTHSGQPTRGGHPSSDRSNQFAASSGTNSPSSESGQFSPGRSTQPSEGIRRTDDSLSRFLPEQPKQQTSEQNPLRHLQAANRAAASGRPAANGNPTNSNASATPSAFQSSGSAGPPPLSNQRGANWALPTRTPGATAYRRPIRVECQEGHYVVHSDDPQVPVQRIKIQNTQQDSVDQLVDLIWKRIEGWGLAELGGYWKPVLRLDSAEESGTTRAAQLARMLEGSGIEIERQWR